MNDPRPDNILNFDVNAFIAQQDYQMYSAAECYTEAIVTRLRGGIPHLIRALQTLHDLASEGFDTQKGRVGLMDDEAWRTALLEVDRLTYRLPTCSDVFKITTTLREGLAFTKRLASSVKRSQELFADSEPEAKEP